MDEKRFVYGRAFAINSDDSLPCITDRQDEKDYVRMSDLVDLLNRQQATINALEQEIELIANNKLFSRRELERKVKEQQANIEQLQDLCGKSDGENAKLRIENKQLKKELKWKREEIKALIKESERDE